MSGDLRKSRIGDEITVTGTVRTIEDLFPPGHIRVTVDVDTKALLAPAPASETARYDDRVQFGVRGQVLGTPAPEAAPVLPTTVQADHVDDGPCQECGQCYVAWWVDHSIWNRVMGGPDATEDPGGFLCPTCFLVKAGPVRGAWHINLPGAT